MKILFGLSSLFLLTAGMNSYPYLSVSSINKNSSAIKIDLIKLTLKKYFEQERTVTILWLEDEYTELLRAISSDTTLESLFIYFNNIKYVVDFSKVYCKVY